MLFSKIVSYYFLQNNLFNIKRYTLGIIWCLLNMTPTNLNLGITNIDNCKRKKQTSFFIYYNFVSIHEELAYGSGRVTLQFGVHGWWLSRLCKSPTCLKDKKSKLFTCTAFTSIHFAYSQGNSCRLYIQVLIPNS